MRHPLWRSHSSLQSPSGKKRELSGDLTAGHYDRVIVGLTCAKLGDFSVQYYVANFGCDKLFCKFCSTRFDCTAELILSSGDSNSSED